MPTDYDPCEDCRANDDLYIWDKELEAYVPFCSGCVNNLEDEDG